jgi:hypothetical protein
MCFSATASFTASTLLLPVGLYCAKKSYEIDKRYLALAAVPFLFGIQQAFEGGLWLAMGESVESRINRMALGFLFFADFFWPFFVPLASAFVEENKRKQHIFLFRRAVWPFSLSSLVGSTGLVICSDKTWFDILSACADIRHYHPPTRSTNYLRYYRRYTFSGFFGQKYSYTGSPSCDFDPRQCAIIFLCLCIRLVLFCGYYLALCLFDNCPYQTSA